MARGKWRKKINSCAGFLTQPIFDKEGECRVLTIIKEEEEQYKFKKPIIKTSSFISNPEFYPKLEIIGNFAEPIILNKNNLTFIAITKNGFVVERKLVKKNKLNLDGNSYQQKAIPHNTKIVIDKNNKRVKLIGKKSISEWIEVDVIPPHPNTGNKYALNYLIKHKLKKELHKSSEKTYI
jgi:hypothetical protein